MPPLPNFTSVTGYIQEFFKTSVNPLFQNSPPSDDVPHADWSNYLHGLKIKAATLVITEMPVFSKAMDTAIASFIVIGLTGVFFKMALIGLAIVCVISLLNEVFKGYLQNFLNWLKISPSLIIIGFPVLAILSFVLSPMTLLLAAGALMLANHFILPELESWAKELSAQCTVSTQSEAGQQDTAFGTAGDSSENLYSYHS